MDCVDDILYYADISKMEATQMKRRERKETLAEWQYRQAWEQYSADPINAPGWARRAFRKKRRVNHGEWVAKPLPFSNTGVKRECSSKE